jgi:uncharacterized damage-inducible protein DinB
MTPEQAHFLLHEIYIPQIRQEHATTRRVIEAVPAERSDYKPDEKSMSAWQLACHIATTEMFFMSAVSNGVFNRADAALPEHIKTPAELSNWYAESHAKAVEILAAIPAADLIKNISFAIFNFPAVQYPAMMLSHSTHHRGQLSAYLRPMGAKVPRIYGGSADDPIDFSKAQKQG